MQFELLAVIDGYWVEVNLATLTSWGHYKILNFDNKVKKPRGNIALEPVTPSSTLVTGTSVATFVPLKSVTIQRQGMHS